MGLRSVCLAVLAAVATGVGGWGLVTVLARLRRWRADRGGFLAFFDSGAPHHHPRLQAALRGASAGRSDTDLIAAGNLALPSGRLVVGDAAFLDADDALALEQVAAPGTYPVVLVRWRSADHEEQRVAALAVLMAPDTPIDHLTPAFRVNERDMLRQQRRLPAIGIDSATFAVAPVEVLAAVPSAEALSQPGAAAGNPYLSHDAADLWWRVDTAEGRIVLALSGKGDGTYPIWLGRAADGRAVAVIVDFCLLGQALPIR